MFFGWVFFLDFVSSSTRTPRRGCIVRADERTKSKYPPLIELELDGSFQVHRRGQ